MVLYQRFFFYLKSVSNVLETPLSTLKKKTYCVQTFNVMFCQKVKALIIFLFDSRVEHINNQPCIQLQEILGVLVIVSSENLFYSC